MKIFDSRNAPELIQLLLSGAVGVIKTDTLYGIVAAATQPDAVERIYTIRERTPGKPLIILAASEQQVMDLVNTDSVEEVLGELWPGPNSVILPIQEATPEYLHRGTGTLAVRVPDDTELRTLLVQVGPIVAPSANPQGLEPASTIVMAQEYFGETVDFYVDSGPVNDVKPSNLIAINRDGTLEKLR